MEKLFTVEGQVINVQNNRILKNHYLANFTVINCFKQESSLYAKGVKVEEWQDMTVSEYLPTNYKGKR